MAKLGFETGQLMPQSEPLGNLGSSLSPKTWVHSCWWWLVAYQVLVSGWGAQVSVQICVTLLVCGPVGMYVSAYVLSSCV